MLKLILSISELSDRLFTAPKCTKVNSCICFLKKVPSQNNSSGFRCLISLETVLKSSSAFAKNLSNLPEIKCVFFAKIIVFDERYFRKLSLFSCSVLFSIFGIIETFFSNSLDSCVSTSKLLILSISFPKNSIL